MAGVESSKRSSYTSTRNAYVFVTTDKVRINIEGGIISVGEYDGNTGRYSKPHSIYSLALKVEDMQLALDEWEKVKDD